MTARLPKPGGDDNTWGDILNSYLEVSLNADGTLKTSAVSASGAEQAANKGVAGGYAQLDSSTKVPIALLPATALSSDSDVNITSPINNQVLTYNSGTSKWINQTSPAGVVLDNNPADIQPLGTQAAGSTGKAADASHVHAMPTLNLVNAPTADVSLNSHKITNLTNGSGAQDAAAFGQIPTTAAQITNAADKSSGSQQNFTGELKAPDLVAAGLTGATAASRYVGATASGAPASGTFVIGDFIIDQTGQVWICTTAGSPGTWKQPVPSSVVSDSRATAKGDLLAASGVGAFGVVNVGGNGTVLTADSTQTDGVKWAAPGNLVVSALGNVTGTTNLDASLASVWTATLTGTTTFNFINVPSGKLFAPQIIVTQNNSVAYTVSFTVNSVVITPQWDTGVAMVQNATLSSTTIWNLETPDAGTTWYGQGQT